MSPTKQPDQAIPENPPTVKTIWTTGVGEKITWEWPKGTSVDLKALYKTLKSQTGVGLNLETMTHASVEGHASLVASFSNTNELGEGDPDTVTTVEELYAVDVIKDIREAPYFAKTVDGAKGLPLTDDQINFVALCAENKWTTNEIDKYVADNPNITQTLDWSNPWTTGMIELRYHMMHGVESYFETAFILRRSKYGVRSSQIKAAFTGINTVVNPPGFSTPMDQLLGALPTGEWLKKPPQTEYLKKGKWRVKEEWHYATLWSIIYGGTWNVP